jgi:hypothetical protein
MKTIAGVLIGSFALTTTACSSDDKANGGGPDGGSGAAGSGTGGSGNETGGNANGGGSGGGAGTGTDAGVGRTSTTCGSVPILGDFWGSPPAECASCVEANCCAEANACAASASCDENRECQLSCGLGDSACRGACTAAGSEGTAFGACRAVKCPECADLSCAQTPLETPASGTYTANWYLFNFATRAGAPDLTVKVCAATDTDCANPLTTGVTDAGGNVDLSIPTAPGWTTAYMEVTGAGIISQLNFPRGRGGFNQRMGFPVLDTKTAAAFIALAGSAGAPDGSAPTLGSLGVQAQSCANFLLAGVTFESSAGGVVSYIAGGIPSMTAKATNESGQGGIVDVPPGPVTVTMKRDGKRLGSTDVFVRAGWYTTLSIPPGP